jgi:hypothetical protein
VFGTKITESNINGTDYVRSLKAILILSNAFEKLKWQAFFELRDTTKFSDFLRDLSSLKTALSSKNTKRSQEAYSVCKSNFKLLQYEFDLFSGECEANSELCRYWDGLVKLARILKKLIAADREGNWTAHLQAMQDLLPVFLQSGSINYLRYGSWYVESMRKLPIDYPQVYQEFMEGKFVVKSNSGYF